MDNKKYQVMPDLSDEEFQSLKEDIRERGVLVHVEYDEDDNILDGYHRVRACNELGIKEWPSVVRAGMTEEQKRTHARKLNLARRHLNQEQKRELIREQLKETPKLSDNQIAKMLGVSWETVNNQRKILIRKGQVLESRTSKGADGKEYPRERETPKQSPPAKEQTEEEDLSKDNNTRLQSIFLYSNKDQEKAKRVLESSNDEDVKREITKISKGKSSLDKAIKMISSKEKEQKTQQEIEEKSKQYQESPDKYKVYHGDFYEICNEFEDNSIDCIVTDPPYPQEYLYLWSQLSEIASRVLKPSGFCIAYSGQTYLDETIKRLSESLIYYWTFCLSLSGNKQLIHGRNIVCTWKPVLVFQKVPFKKISNTIPDTIIGSGREKDLYEWQQGEKELADIISGQSV